MQTLRDIRLFAAVLLGTAVCLFATVSYAYPLLSGTFFPSSHNFLLCDAADSFLFTALIGTPVERPTEEAYALASPGGRRDQARPHTLVPPEHRLDLASAGDPVNGHRKDKKTVPQQNKAAPDSLAAFPLRHVSLPNDGIFIGTPPHLRGVHAKLSGRLRAGP